MKLPPGAELSLSALEWFRQVLHPWLSRDTSKKCNREMTQATWVVQNAGDFVWVPNGWWHCVVNLELSAAYQAQIVTKHNMKACVETCESYAPQFVSRLKKHVQSDHADD